MTRTQLLSLIIAVWLDIAPFASASPNEKIPTIPDFTKGEKYFPKHLSKQKATAVREAIWKIESAKDHPDLRPLK